MRIFVSWSGERGRALGTAVREFIPLIFQRAQVFTTADDIDKGSRWSTVLRQELESVDTAIICLTPESLNSPWLAFEAGAILTRLGPSHIFVLAAGLSVADVSGPLAAFQISPVDRSSCQRLFEQLNRGSEPVLSESVLSRLFEAMWPSFDTQLQSLLSGSERESKAVTARPDRDLLEELVVEVRQLKKRMSEIDK
jgi:hypothetical protein